MRTRRNDGVDRALFRHYASTLHSGFYWGYCVCWRDIVGYADTAVHRTAATARLRRLWKRYE